MDVTKHPRWRELEEICNRISGLEERAERLRKIIGEESRGKKKIKKMGWLDTIFGEEDEDT